MPGPRAGTGARFDDSDPIAPVRIEHSVDEVWGDGVLEAYYNFLDYYFERDRAVCRARFHIDDVRSVTLFGPFEAQDLHRRIGRPDFERDVMAYLNRRFETVLRG